MQNFVFKTRNPEYSWWIFGAIGISFYIQIYLIGDKFLTSWILVAILGLATNFFFTSTITIKDKQIVIKKHFMTVIYYEYQCTYEYIIFTGDNCIEFINQNNEVIYFFNDDNDSYDGNEDEFVVKISNRKIILGGSKKDFTYFKESLEEWNKQ